MSSVTQSWLVALAAASEHKRRVAEAARIVAARSAELNRRLA